MTKTETLRRLSAATNENRLERLAQQIETVHQSKVRSADELAEILEPLAQAMAALTDETRETLGAIGRESVDQAARFQQQIETATNSLWHSANEARRASQSLHEAGLQMTLIHYVMVVMTSLLSAALTSAFWLWLAPPHIANQLDPKAVAEALRPAVTTAVTDALKRSRNK